MQAVSIPHSGTRVGKTHLFRKGNVIPCSAGQGGLGGGAGLHSTPDDVRRGTEPASYTNTVLTYVVGVKRNLVRVYASMTRRKWGDCIPPPVPKSRARACYLAYLLATWA